MARGRFRVAAATGFTLIEVLVVLAVVGISLAMLGLGSGVLDRLGGGASDVEATARRLAVSLARAGELAQVRGRPLRVDFLAGGYRFLSLDAGGRWVSVEGDPLLAERTVANDLRWVEASADGDALMPPFHLQFGGEPRRFMLRLVDPHGSAEIRGDSAGKVESRRSDLVDRNSP